MEEEGKALVGGAIAHAVFAIEFDLNVSPMLITHLHGSRIVENRAYFDESVNGVLAKSGVPYELWVKGESNRYHGLNG